VNQQQNKNCITKNLTLRVNTFFPHFPHRGYCVEIPSYSGYLVATAEKCSLVRLGRLTPSMVKGLIYGPWSMVHGPWSMVYDSFPVHSLSSQRAPPPTFIPKFIFSVQMEGEIRVEPDGTRQPPMCLFFVFFYSHLS